MRKIFGWQYRSYKPILIFGVKMAEVVCGSRIFIDYVAIAT